MLETPKDPGGSDITPVGSLSRDSVGPAEISSNIDQTSATSGNSTNKASQSVDSGLSSQSSRCKDMSSTDVLNVIAVNPISHSSIMRSTSVQNISMCSSSASEERTPSFSKNTAPHGRSGSVSVTAAAAALAASNNKSTLPHYDRLTLKEIRNLLICFMQITKSLSSDILHTWWDQCTESELLEFLSVTETCLLHFRYQGRKIAPSVPITSFSMERRSMSMIPTTGLENRSRTLPTSVAQTYAQFTRHSTVGPTELSLLNGPITGQPVNDQSEMEAHTATEVGLCVLDLLDQFCLQYRVKLTEKDGDNMMLRKVFEVYMLFLQMGQSDVLLKHVFASLRQFISKFQLILFRGDPSYCGTMCYELLKSCNSRLASTRNEACGLLYLLMRSNYDYTKKVGFVRVHLQVIISVSKLVGDDMSCNISWFQESLAAINNFATSDKPMQQRSFPTDVKDLTKKIRTVLMATTQLRDHENDPEKLVDLRHDIANSYASNAILRQTWLFSMAKIHIKHGNFSEAAFCYIHCAAIASEFLKRKSGVCNGCGMFAKISPNIEADESGLKDDFSGQDVEFSESTLAANLESAVTNLMSAERYELLGEVYRLAIPIYEKQRDFQMLAEAYGTLHKAYCKVNQVMISGRRFLGTYYRVAFFGPCFDFDDGKQYIYKEPKITNLTEISERLQKLYEDKFESRVGRENVKIIRDSSLQSTQGLDPKMNHIQVTSVIPYIDEREMEEKKTDFERHNNIRRFMFETPFTMCGRPHGTVEEQFKRKTILTTSHSFPYVKKRVQVLYTHNHEFSPIEVAIDEMTDRVNALHELVTMTVPDMKRLQLKLQGSVSVQVNAGPLAYASAFLSNTTVFKYKPDKVELLKHCFRRFISECTACLELNSKLIKSDQAEYQEELKQGLKDLTRHLSIFLGDEVDGSNHSDRLSSRASQVSILSAISSAGNV